MGKKSKKKLSVSKETLRSLQKKELSKVAGGAPTDGCNPITVIFGTCTCADPGCTAGGTLG